MKRPHPTKPADRCESPSERRVAGLEALAAEEVAELRALTPEAGIRILEDLLDAGFDLIDEMLEEARREGRDVAALARFLFEDQPL